MSLDKEFAISRDAELLTRRLTIMAERLQSLEKLGIELAILAYVVQSVTTSAEFY
jgi:hypothetical protein